MNGFLELSDALLCSIGTLPHEHEALQQVSWHLRAEIELPKEDLLAQTIDYMEIKQFVRTRATATHTQLLETLAQNILTGLLKEFPLLSATLRVTKERYNATVEVSGCNGS